MITLKTLPSDLSRGIQEVYLYVGSINSGQFANAAVGPFLLNSAGAIGTNGWYVPDYVTHSVVDYGPPINLDTADLRQENQCSHVNAKGILIFDHRDQDNNMACAKSIAGTENSAYWLYSQPDTYFKFNVFSWLRPNGTYSPGLQRRFGINGDTFTDKSVGSSSYWRDPASWSGIKLLDTSRNAIQRNVYEMTNSVTPTYWKESTRYVTEQKNSVTGKYSELYSNVREKDLTATQYQYTGDSVLITYTGVSTNTSYDATGKVTGFTSVPYTKSIYGYFTSPRLSCSLELRERLLSPLWTDVVVRSKVARAILALEKVTIDHYTTAQKALEQLKVLDMNNIENSIQFKGGAAGFLPPFREAAKVATDPENPVKWAKVISKLYLWWKYSVKPNVNDFEELITNYKLIMEDQLKRDYCQWRTFRATTKHETEKDGHLVTYTIHSKVMVRAALGSAVSTAYLKLDSLGLAPNLRNLWDLVPFSFVVDWFLTVGDLLQCVDSKVERNKFDVAYHLAGSKRTTILSNSDFQLDHVVGGSDITVSVYQRSLNYGLPRVRYEFGSVNPTRHIFDGTALIIANW